MHFVVSTVAETSRVGRGILPRLSAQSRSVLAKCVLQRAWPLIRIVPGLTAQFANVLSAKQLRSNDWGRQLDKRAPASARPSARSFSALLECPRTFTNETLIPRLSQSSKARRACKTRVRLVCGLDTLRTTSAAYCESYSSLAEGKPAWRSHRNATTMAVSSPVLFESLAAPRYSGLSGASATGPHASKSQPDDGVATVKPQPARGLARSSWFDSRPEFPLV